MGYGADKNRGFSVSERMCEAPLDRPRKALPRLGIQQVAEA
jgi:hypothetical protein